MTYSLKGYTPKQEDIIIINFNPSVGREIQKKRPALVISKEKTTSSGLLEVVFFRLIRYISHSSLNDANRSTNDRTIDHWLLRWLRRGFHQFL